MTKLLGMALVLIAMSTSLMAGVVIVPEIDGSTSVAAIALLAGGVLVLRARRKK